MPRTLLTDISVQRLKPTTGRQTRFYDETLPGFGVLVSQRIKSFFIVKGEDRKLITLGRYPEMGLKEARIAAKREMVQPTKTDSPDAQEAIETYLAECKGRIEKQTHDQYTYYLNTFEFDGPLSEITRTAIKRKLASLHDKPTAANMAYATLRGFLNWCLRQEYLDKHPLLGMTPPNKLSSRERVLSDDELKAIWTATGTDGSAGWLKFCRIVRVLILTGQRRQEICELEPEHVSDFIHIIDPKNDFTHTIPVTPLVKEHLQVPYDFNDWNRCKELLDKRIGSYFAENGLTNTITAHPWTIHDLRRTFSTNCAKLGIPLHITETILNHRSGTISGVARIYNRYQFLKEMDDALMAHEEHIRKVCEIRKPEPPMPPDERYLGRVTTVLRTS